MTPPDEPRRVQHPRDLVCPRCRADVGRPCSFAGHVQKEIHCTERLLALGDPDLRVEAEPEGKPPAATPQKRRPLPSASDGTKAAPEAGEDAPLTLFG